MIDALIVCRLVHFGATMFVFGALAYRRVLLASLAAVDGRSLDARLRAPLAAAGVLSFVSAAAWLCAEGAAMSGTPSGAFDVNTLAAALFDTQFGSVWIWRLLLALSLAIALTVEHPFAFRFRLPLAFLTLASLGFVGHAAMAPGFAGAFQRFNHAAHLLAAGAWSGGIACLGIALRQSAARVEVLRRFSHLGYGAVGLVLASGIVNSCFLIAGPADLVSTPYGWTLCLKVLFVTGMLALAAVHRFVLLPRVVAGRSADRLLMRSLSAELGLAVCAIAAASVLGTLPPPL
jgi:putative copper resistance protein D